MVEKSLRELDMRSLTRRAYTPSPAAWEDQVLYFLMLDRFSDGREQGFRGNDGRVVSGGVTPLFQPGEAGNAIQTADDAARWRTAGGGWVGGNLKGLASKIGYLQRLGVTALWISPVFKQVRYQDTYHGYGIQNFLDVDPHFGTRARPEGAGAHRPPPRDLRDPGYHPEPFAGMSSAMLPIAT